MTTKEFLQQAIIVHQAVESRIEQIARLQSLATRTTTVLKGVPSAGTKDYSRIEATIRQVQESSAQLADEIARMVEVRNEVADAIARVKNPTERRILELRYLCGFSWGAISRMIYMTARNIRIIHGRALRNVAELVA